MQTVTAAHSPNVMKHATKFIHISLCCTCNAPGGKEIRRPAPTVTPAGPDQWHVHITFPYFPSLTIDEKIPSTQLVDVYVALGGQPLRAATQLPAAASCISLPRDI